MHLRIARKWQEARDVFGFHLQRPDGGILQPFSAGSHIDVEAAPGLTRQYSLCNAPGSTSHYEIAVLRDPESRGGSRTLCDAFCEGDLVQVSAPRNHFELHPTPGRSLMLAGGIGITPLLCMSERLSTIEAEFELHYCSRSPERTAFMERIGTSVFADRVRFHFDDGAPAQRLDIAEVLSGRSAEDRVYVCGPAGFLEWVRSSARTAGWPEDHVHFEYFTAPATESGGESFELVLGSSGRSTQVAPNETIVDALLRIGVDVPVACQQGVCGACVTRVLEGIPDHRDYYLTDAEQSSAELITPCCSRVKGTRLVLDL